jgi:hypothetical protein
MSSISSTLPAVTNPVSATVPKSTTIGQTKNSGLAQTAASLSTDVAIIGTLAGLNAGPDAVSLLDFLEQTTPITSSQSSASSSGSGSGTSTSGSGSATSSSSAGSGSTDVNANWASILKQSPGMAYTVAADNYNQGVVSTLNAFA